MKKGATKRIVVVRVGDRKLYNNTMSKTDMRNTGEEYSLDYLPPRAKQQLALGIGRTFMFSDDQEGEEEFL